ncbi:MAG: insulinase family protein [Alphaproteobacteria bacterium]|nr:insulinase family protein [Alphaproteobacteria bacterium]
MLPLLLTSAALAEPHPLLTTDAQVRTLDNGLVVIVEPQRRADVVALYLRYGVGARDEAEGEGGCAHLFEHLMFEGSENAPGASFDDLTQAAGAWNNAWTSADETAYHMSMPSGALDLALFLESDRLGFLDVADVEVQQDVVLQERAEGYAEPHGADWDVLTTLAWPEGHPYHVPIIGTVDDIQAFSDDRTRAFWSTHYVPANGTLALVGLLEPEATFAAVERWFSDVPPRAAAPERAAAPPLPERHVDGVFEDDVADHALYLAWPVPGRFSADEPAMELLSVVLSYGRGTRLDDALYYDRRLTESTWVGLDAGDLGSLFVLEAYTSRRRVRRVARAMEDVIAELAERPPTIDELERARAALRGWLLDMVEQPEGRAEWLATCQAYFGTPDCLEDLWARYEAVTPDDLVRVAETWLTPERRVSLSVVPEGRARRAVRGAVPVGLP